MSDITIQIFHTGTVCVAPDLPFGGDHSNALKSSGIFGRKSDRLWLPVSSYLIEYDDKKILFDTGWHRNMSPEGIYDRKAQIRSLGSYALYRVNQGVVPEGQAINEQLETQGVEVRNIDAVLISHLDCDHANGLKLVSDARNILVAQDELDFATNGSLMNRIRYYRPWWEGTKIRGFAWNGTEGPAGKSYDVFGDGKIVMINIPGHSNGLCALRVMNADGRYVLLFADGGYATKSWSQNITSGIAADKQAQKKSLAWIRDMSMDPRCVASLANHDADVEPHIIKF
ncbi:MBL fold metallo-hydrolase [Alloscardovia criceti]|uniref:MBL fold metallo-hydrolase n=1 Tax=Alloscardovia criceti TaxID=356828 RepID=UPI0004772A86|nr:MBL fold metallo-hydrolase [Alloscardovia criceti]